MSGFRWLLALLGVLLLGFIFWLSRRELSGQAPINTGRFSRGRKAPVLKSFEDDDPNPAAEATDSPTPEPLDVVMAPPAIQVPDRILTVRLTGRGGASFAGEALRRALEDAGLQHGRFGIFHRCHQPDRQQSIFSVASLVEPGSFDLSSMDAERLPGVSMFMTVPGPVDALSAFDDMLATARDLATILDGEVLDEQGSRLSVQRERFLRDELVQLRRRTSAI